MTADDMTVKRRFKFKKRIEKRQEHHNDLATKSNLITTMCIELNPAFFLSISVSFRFLTDLSVFCAQLPAVLPP